MSEKPMYIQMAQSMSGSGKKTSRMAMGSKLGKMALVIKGLLIWEEAGTRDIQLVRRLNLRRRLLEQQHLRRKANIPGATDASSKERGSTTRWMEKGFSLESMDAFMREAIRKIKSKDMACSSGLMDGAMKVSYITGSSMGKEFI